MNEKKIIQQKWLARILIGCAIVIIFFSFLNRQINLVLAIGILFLTVGVVTLRRAIVDEMKLK